MSEHGNLVVFLVFVSCINIFTGIVMFREEQKLGLTVKTGTRRKAIMAVTSMSIVSSAAALGLILYDYMSLAPAA